MSGERVGVREGKRVRERGEKGVTYNSFLGFGVNFIT